LASVPTTITYAVGDIHGCYDQLIRLLSCCKKHSGDRPSRFVFLGDYIDRGPDSRKVVDFLIRAEASSPRQFVCLRGNHEKLFSDAVASNATGSQRAAWFQNGGLETMASFDVTDIEAIPDTHKVWLASRPLTRNDGKRLFVHAGVRPGIPADKQRERDLLWIREPFLSSPADHGRLVVHGHTPTASGKPDIRSNRVNLDTGACFGRRLTAAAFSDERIMPLALINDAGQVSG
jgi:serine/threonine protein phosphatase 1